MFGGPLYVTAAAAMVVASVPLFVWSLGGIRVRRVSRGDAVVDQRQAVLRDVTFDRVVLPTVRALGRQVRRLTPVGWVEALERRVRLAGSPAGWTVERALALKLVVGVLVALSVLVWGDGALTPGRLGVVVGGGVLGYVFPDAVLLARGRDDVQVLDEGGHPVAAGTLGAIAVKLPLPPGTLPTLWNAEERFKKSYLTTFPGYYETGDAGYIDEDGYLYIMARTDDVINVAGHRLSTGAMEEVLAGHPDVAECAVIGVADTLKGQSPLGFLCLNSGSGREEADVVKECVKLMRDKIGPVADFKRAVVVNRLPKTRSGKILRSTMVKIADNQPFKAPATIEDPAVLDEIKLALQSLGLAQG